MEPVSKDQFMINYLRQRIAQITVQYEDSIANHVIQTQILTQERDDLRVYTQNLTNQVSEQDEEIERLRMLCEEKEIEDSGHEN